MPDVSWELVFTGWQREERPDVQILHSSHPVDEVLCGALGKHGGQVTPAVARL